MHHSTISRITSFNTLLLTLEIITFLQKTILSCNSAYTEALGPTDPEVLKVTQPLRHAIVPSSLTRPLSVSVPLLCPHMYQLSGEVG